MSPAGNFAVTSAFTVTNSSLKTYAVTNWRSGNVSLADSPALQGATLSYTGALAVEIFCDATKLKHLQLPQVEVRRDHI